MIKSIGTKTIVWVAVVVVLAGIVAWVVVAQGQKNGTERFAVERRDVVETVSVFGTVEAGTVAELGFEVPGRVENVSKTEGDFVSAGELLVSLSTSDLQAELARARADVAIAQAETQNSGDSLFDVIAREDTKVRNAYSTLLSSDLIAVPANNDETATAPTITGRYTGSEGQYKLRVVRRGGTAEYDLFVFGIETIGPVRISRTDTTPLGTLGLSVSFPDALQVYNDKVWFVDIPNTDGDSFVANQNAYEEALTNREVAIEEAESRFESGVGASIADAELARARAEVARIEAEIAERQLRAPFNGTLAQLEVSQGEVVSANEVVASLISSDLGVAIDLPEIDSVKVAVGDPAMIVLDAFSADEPMKGTVAVVSRTETVVEGVSVYESRIVFAEADERIRSGMTAEVIITTDTREDVLALPLRAIDTNADVPTVVVQVGDKKQERDVTLGLTGTDGFVEILSGLSEGDTVIRASDV